MIRRAMAKQSDAKQSDGKGQERRGMARRRKRCDTQSIDAHRRRTASHASHSDGDAKKSAAK